MQHHQLVSRMTLSQYRGPTQRAVAKTKQKKENANNMILSSLFLIIVSSVLEWPTLTAGQTIVVDETTVTAPISSSFKISTIPTTSTAVPTGFIEDPLSTTTNESSEEDDSMCLSCYDKVKVAQEHIEKYYSLEKDQKNLIRNLIRQQHLEAITSAQSPIPKPMANKRPRVSAANQSKNSTKTIRNRKSNLQSSNKAAVAAQFKAKRSVNELRVDRNAGLRSRDPALKRIKQLQVKQISKTCKKLYEVQQCLNEISKECVGNLQYHSHEVLIKQWLIRLNCPPSNDPSFKPYSGLTRSIERIEEREKVPLPRPISTDEETRRKLDVILGGRGATPFGVMLKPKLDRENLQRLDPIEQEQIDTEQLEKGQRGRVQLSASMSPRYSKRQLESQTAAMAGQLLLIPCLIGLIIALINITLNRYLKR